MSVKGYLALLVGVFVAALAVVTVTQRATGDGTTAILVPVLVTLGAVAVAALLVRLVLRDIARPFHSAGVNIRSNVDQLSAVVQRLAATTAEQSSGVAETSATMEELPGRPPRSPRRSTASPPRPTPPATTWSRPSTTSGPRASEPWPLPTGWARSGSPSP